MARSRGETVPIVELLGVGATTTTAGDRPAVLITIRPEPQKSWKARSFAIRMEQAERLRDDLQTLLKHLESPRESKRKNGKM